MAAAGTVLGSMLTFWIGRKVGKHGLARLIGRSRFERVKRRLENAAAPGVVVLAIIPPPFPLSAFVLGAGAFGLNAWRFFGTFAAVKLVRYGVESVLAVRFGTGIVAWMDSSAFELIVGAFIVLIVGGTIVSLVALVRRKG